MERNERKYMRFVPDTEAPPPLPKNDLGIDGDVGVRVTLTVYFVPGRLWGWITWNLRCRVVILSCCRCPPWTHFPQMSTPCPLCLLNFLSFCNSSVNILIAFQGRYSTPSDPGCSLGSDRAGTGKSKSQTGACRTTQHASALTL